MGGSNDIPDILSNKMLADNTDIGKLARVTRDVNVIFFGIPLRLIDWRHIIRPSYI